jgi:hypothetical protein
VGAAHNLMAVNHAMILQKPWGVDELWQALRWIVWLGQMCMPYTWLVNTGLNSFDDRVTVLYMVNGSTWRHVLHGLINCPMICKENVYNVPKTCIEESAIQAGMWLQSE